MLVQYVGRSQNGVYLPAIDAHVGFGEVVEVDDDTAESLLRQGGATPQWARTVEGHEGPPRNAGKGVWVAYATTLGFTAEQLGGKSRDELISLVESGSPADTNMKGDD